MNKTTRMMLLANQSKKNGEPGRDGGHRMNREYGDWDDARMNYGMEHGRGLRYGYDPYDRPRGREHGEMYGRHRRMRDPEYDPYEDEYEPDGEGSWNRQKARRHERMNGAGMAENYPAHIGETDAREWVMKMKNADGSQGAHFTPEAAEQLRASHCPDCERWDFFAAVNMIYSDYGAAMKKFGMDKPEIYACLAKAFLCDEDAKEGKMTRYVESISK